LRKVLLATACLLVVVVPAAAGASVAGPAAVRFDPNKKISQSTSSNWSGYSAINGRYTSVSANWTQPAASCTSATTYSSFWVGLDGNGSNTVEQTGTSADCSGGTPRYYAWYEMYPKFPVNLSLAIHPGDSIGGSVTTDGEGHFTLTITDRTTGSFTTTQRLPRARLLSAEAIAEAPSGSGGVLPLTNFGTASFTSTTVNGAPIGSFNPDRIDMVSGGVTKASTSGLGNDGASFSVTWQHS